MDSAVFCRGTPVLNELVNEVNQRHLEHVVITQKGCIESLQGAMLDVFDAMGKQLMFI
ncbi:MAG: hypothetical protein ACLRQX_06160 [Turicibacter sanguinis]